MSEEDIELFDIVIRSLTGRDYEMKVTSVDTIQNVKETLDKAWKIPQTECILIFNDQELNDEDVLADVGVQNGSNLFMTLRMSGGPLSIGGKVYTAGVQNLKDALERTKKALAKKYSSGCRVLVLLYKDQDGNHNVVKIFDENDNAKKNPDNEDVSVVEASLNATPKNEEKLTLSSSPGFQRNRVNVLEKLQEELRMKLKVSDLKKKMKESAERKKHRKAMREVKIGEDVTNKEISVLDDKPNIDGMDFYGRTLFFNREFSYTTFMKVYYDKCKHTAEMMSYNHLNFRIVQERCAGNDFPHIVGNEVQAFKEKNRLQSHYIFIKRPDENFGTKLLRVYENTKREEMEAIAFGMKESGYTITAVQERLQEYASSDLLRAIEEPDEPTSATLEDLRTCVSKLNLQGASRRAIGRGSASYDLMRRSTPTNTPAGRSLSPSYGKHKPWVVPAISPRKLYSYKRQDPLKPSGLKLPSSIGPRASTSSSEEESCSPDDSDASEECNSSTDTADTDYEDAEDDYSVVTDLDDPEVPERIETVRELPPLVVEKRNKCAVCRRRLNLISRFDCRCGKIYCPQHRHAENHNCSYDYRGHGKEVLAKQNPRIVGEKIKKL